MIQAYLTDVDPADSNGVKWAKVGAWVKQACVNRGKLPGSGPYLTDILPTDSEGVKWAKLQRWFKVMS